jgi:FAD synthase
MNRGDFLEWGFSIDSDGKQFNVTLAGSQRPDLRFDTFEAMIEWMEEEWQGLQIKRMGKQNG